MWQPGCGPCSWGSAVPWHAGGQLTVPPCCLSKDSPHLPSHYMITFPHLLLLHHHLPFHPPKKKRTETWERLDWCWDETIGHISITFLIQNHIHVFLFIPVFMHLWKWPKFYWKDMWYWRACVPNFKIKTENISLWKHCKRETEKQIQ